MGVAVEIAGVAALPLPLLVLARMDRKILGQNGHLELGDLKPCLVVTHRKMEVMNPSGNWICPLHNPPVL